MSVAIGPMEVADLQAVIELWNNTPGVGLNESDEPDCLRAYLARNPGLSLAARDGSALIGAVLCGHDGRRGYLNHLAVAPDYRRRGLGQQMVMACLDKLAALGIARCNIFIYADNEPGERFWTRCGWRPRSDLKVLQRQTTETAPIAADINSSTRGVRIPE